MSMVSSRWVLLSFVRYLFSRSDQNTKEEKENDPTRLYQRGFNVQFIPEMLVVEELYEEAVVNTSRKLILFNGELDRIRSGCILFYRPCDHLFLHH